MATKNFPQNWLIAADYDPNNHLMQLKGRDYLNVQNRMLWFLRDQRRFIADGLATHSYVIQTDLVEMDREAGFAHFKTYVRDVLGNEATMYGSESAKDFGDFAEKASTKSLGRALLALGYGTAFAPEMDEGERVVDAPVERKTQTQGQTQTQRPSAMERAASAPKLDLSMERLPATINVQNVKDFADEYGMRGAIWGKLYNDHKGDLDLIWRDIRHALTPPAR